MYFRADENHFLMKQIIDDSVTGTTYTFGPSDQWARRNAPFDDKWAYQRYFHYSTDAILPDPGGTGVDENGGAVVITENKHWNHI